MTGMRPWLASLVFVATAVASSMIGTGTAHALSCTASVSAPAFGSPDILAGGAIDAVGTLSISCTGTGAERNITVLACPNMNLGTGNQAVGAPVRRLANGANKLAFNLYQDAYTTLWGGSPDMGGTAPAVLVALDSNGNGNSSSLPIYARIAAGQSTVPVGLYQSLITVDVRSSTTTGFGCDTVNTNSSSSSFSVSANYLSNCIMATSNLSFGTLGGLASAIDAEAPLSLTCSAGGAYTVSLDGGQSAASDPTQRKMSKSGSTLVYGLYRDAARQLPWGSDATTMRSGTGTGNAQSISVFGRIPVQVMPPPGTYQDVIVATVNY